MRIWDILLVEFVVLSQMFFVTWHALHYSFRDALYAVVASVIVALSLLYAYRRNKSVVRYHGEKSFC
jgi:hypothetical protein